MAAGRLIVRLRRGGEQQDGIGARRQQVRRRRTQLTHHRFHLHDGGDLVRDGGEELHVARIQAALALRGDGEYADHLVLPDHRDDQRRTDARRLQDVALRLRESLLVRDVVDQHRPARARDHLPHRAIRVIEVRVVPGRHEFIRHARERGGQIGVVALLAGVEPHDVVSRADRQLMRDEAQLVVQVAGGSEQRHQLADHLGGSLVAKRAPRGRAVGRLALALRHVHRVVRKPDHLFDRCRFGRVHGAAGARDDRDRRVRLRVVDLCVAEPSDHVVAVRFRIGARNAGQHDEKLIAPVAADDCASRLQRRRHSDERGVADEMAVHVVHGLHAVNVHHDDGERRRRRGARALVQDRRDRCMVER